MFLFGQDYSYLVSGWSRIPTLKFILSYIHTLKLLVPAILVRVSFLEKQPISQTLMEVEKKKQSSYPA